MTVNIKDEAKSLIDQLDEKYVKEIANFMLWLKDREEWEAKMRLLADKRTQRAYQEKEAKAAELA